MNDSLIGTIVNRIYADFVMPSRLDDYRTLLKDALARGYRITSIEGFWRSSIPSGPPAGERWLVLRHDVDTDPGTARKMFQIERDLGVTSSYYFRLATIDVHLMADIASHGGEASYHYEELATVAKRRRPRGRAEALELLPEARDLFARDLEWFRGETGTPASIVASHGDFVNRLVATPNWEILADRSFRASVGVELETYDSQLLDRYSSRFSDTQYPRYWVDGDPVEAMGRADPAVQILVHPRHWHTARSTNALDDTGAAYRGAPVSPSRSVERMTSETPSGPQAADTGAAGHATVRRARARLAWASTILRAPRVEIRLFGDAHARRIHDAFTARHRRLRFTNAKRWGVALIPIPATFDEYLSGSTRKVLRQKRRLAEKAGFHHEIVKAADHLDEILAVNRSAPLRQGGALPAYYLDPAALAAIYADRTDIHAIMDASGRLRAYAWAPDAGELVLIETLMGHWDDLEVGIMYLLISEIIRSAVERHAERGLPRWAMYDTFWGASTGLAYFKSRLGFKPFTVRWVWSGSAISDPRPSQPAGSQPTT